MQTQGIGEIGVRRFSSLSGIGGNGRAVGWSGCAQSRDNHMYVRVTLLQHCGWKGNFSNGGGCIGTE
jgi:hypothetical protein